MVAESRRRGGAGRAPADSARAPQGRPAGSGPTLTSRDAATPGPAGGDGGWSFHWRASLSPGPAANRRAADSVGAHSEGTISLMRSRSVF